MECNSRTGWIALALVLLALMLAPAPVRGGDPVQYNVGNIPGDPNWFRHPEALTFYQDWADGLTLYVNDSLLFLFDDQSDDVTQVWTASDLNSCSIADPASYFTGGSITLYLPDPGTFFFTSTGLSSNISGDCVNGMRFSITVNAGASPSPDPDPQQGSHAQHIPDLTSTIQWERQPDANHYTNFFPGPLRNLSAIAFNFTQNEHNVVRVNQSDFDSCNVNASMLLGKYNIPNSVLVLGEDGDTVYYYIDGIGDNCANGHMKLRVQLEVVGTSAGKTFPVAAVAVPVVIVSTLVLALLGFLYYRRNCGSKPRGRYPERRVVTSGRFGKSGLQASAAISGILKGNAGNGLAAFTIFTYDELERATKGFSADNEAGRGGFGTVYKGILDDGRTVAIKIAKHASDVESFVNEVAILSQVNNRNLVKLLGCCIEVDIPLLVYEFIPNGTLQDHLSVADKGFSTRLDWNTRFRIALQTAEALKYLHVQATPPIFHRDVKSANILLDDHFNGKVADFGLSKLVDLEATHVSTLVKGTPGYLDPEYYHNFQLTDKTDVYSFGVVLLELITSKKPIDLSNPAGEQNLAACSIPLIKSGRVREIMDSYMSSSLSREEFQAVEAVAQVAVACLVSSRASRPSMSEVVEMLQRIKGSKLKAEEFYNKADITDSDQTIIEMQAYDISLGDSESTTTRGTSSSGSVTEPMRPR